MGNSVESHDNDVIMHESLFSKPWKSVFTFSIRSGLIRSIYPKTGVPWKACSLEGYLRAKASPFRMLGEVRRKMQRVLQEPKYAVASILRFPLGCSLLKHSCALESSRIRKLLSNFLSKVPRDEVRIDEGQMLSTAPSNTGLNSEKTFVFS